VCTWRSAYISGTDRNPPQSALTVSFGGDSREVDFCTIYATRGRETPSIREPTLSFRFSLAHEERREEIHFGSDFMLYRFIVSRPASDAKISEG
jgi:hypothetical protein